MKRKTANPSSAIIHAGVQQLQSGSELTERDAKRALAAAAKSVPERQRVPF
jgi:hypothetical protein